MRAVRTVKMYVAETVAVMCLQCVSNNTKVCRVMNTINF